MSESQSLTCIICTSTLKAPTHPKGTTDTVCFDCPRCGQFCLTRSAAVPVSSTLERDPGKRAVLSHLLRRIADAERWPVIGSDVADLMVKTGVLPTPPEQADNLIRWLGDNLVGPGEMVRISAAEHGGIIGVRTPSGFNFVVEGLTEAGLLKGSLTMGHNATATLAFAGWARYEELRRGVPSGRKAFIAMQFGTQPLDTMVDTHFRQAVADTGFTLQRLDDVPKAGLIDDRMRVEIQSARFVVVDLTHDNSGAYWEAGYAEGLGKPVIYTCESTKFSAKKTHFDTNHLLTVLWAEAEPKDFTKRLKATIRATIPEAKREDS